MMHFRRALVCLLLIQLTPRLHSAEYAWPLQGKPGLSATFCEPRDGHIHAGIDIKTWGEMEVPCQAVASGTLEKLLVHYGGYGRALFLRLDDGNQVVYAHLERFTSELERRVSELQQEQQHYAVRLDLTPEGMHVESGDIIAYSGTSGTEYPHLHFEIRTQDSLLVNPLQYFPVIQDTRAPVLRKLKIEPLTPGATVNGSQFPMDLPPQSLVLSGEVRFSINVSDYMNGTRNRYAPYHVRAELDDTLFFGWQFRQGSLDAVNELDPYYGDKGSDGWRFLKLYPTPGANTDGYRLTTQKESTSLPAGFHKLLVDVSDFHGNQSQAQWQLRVDSPEEYSFRTSSNRVIIHRIHAPGDDQVRLFRSFHNQPLQPVTITHSLTQTIWEFPGSGSAAGIEVMNVLGEDTLRRTIQPPVQMIPDHFQLEWRPYREQWVGILTSSESFLYPLHYLMKTASGIHRGILHQVSPVKVETEPVSLAQRATAREIQLLGSAGEVPPVPTEPLEQITAGLDRHFVIPESDLRLLLRCAQTGFFQVDTLDLDAGGHRLRGFELTLFPEKGANIEVSITAPSITAKSHLALYLDRSRGRWKRLPRRVGSGGLDADLPGSGVYVLAEDLEPPGVELVRAKNSYRPGERLTFKVRDNFGLITHPDSSIRLQLDGKRIFPDFNPLRGELSFHLPDSQRIDPYDLDLTLMDPQGNETALHGTLRVR